MDPIFLTLDNVIEIHREMIARYGGSDGIRDKGLLESAVATPHFFFLRVLNEWNDWNGLNDDR
jgi:death-on-curing protein